MENRMISKTKIDWCGYVWNPVWGCNRGCEYCYAKKIAKRFAGVIAKSETSYRHCYTHDDREQMLGIIKGNIYNFRPTFLHGNFEKRFPSIHKPSIIFVNSMSDIEYWESEWIDIVLKRIRQTPHHTFVFLTKCYGIYEYINDNERIPENVICGYTACTDKQLILANTAILNEYLNPDCLFMSMISIEPILENIHNGASQFTDWLIIGAETGNRKGKIIPKRNWIEKKLIFRGATFMKESLHGLMGNDFIQEYPKFIDK